MSAQVQLRRSFDQDAFRRGECVRKHQNACANSTRTGVTQRWNRKIERSRTIPTHRHGCFWGICLCDVRSSGSV